MGLWVVMPLAGPTTTRDQSERSNPWMCGWVVGLVAGPEVATTGPIWATVTGWVAGAVVELEAFARPAAGAVDAVSGGASAAATRLRSAWACDTPGSGASSRLAVVGWLLQPTMLPIHSVSVVHNANHMTLRRMASPLYSLLQRQIYHVFPGGPVQMPGRRVKGKAWRWLACWAGREVMIVAMGDAPEVKTGWRLTTPVQELPSVGVKRARCLNRLGIATISDLIRHVPLRYERELPEGAIADLSSEAIASARGIVVSTRIVPGAGRGQRGMRGARFQVTLQDHSATLALVWFNAPYLKDRLHPGQSIRVQGKVTYFQGYPQMVNPKWEPVEENTRPAPGGKERLRPVYPATEDLPSAVIEGLVEAVLPVVLDQLPDPLPPELTKAHNMPVLAQAFRMAHRPEHEDEAKAARRRLAYNELLLLQMGITLKRHYNRTQLKAPALHFSSAIDQHIRARFPFQLTAAQERVVREIARDVAQAEPMNRLLQGDVGAGKTVVALYTLLLAVADRRQGALMTPTELLAEQHFASISRMLAGSNVRLALLTGGSVKGADRAQLLREIESGGVDIVIGTQALLTESVRFNDLAAVVIDEQHRFGVLQRAAFRQRPAGGTAHEDSGKGAEAVPGARPSPHYLVMTATPIPRTLSLTVFGDLDVSVIDQLPPGRTPIVTRVVGPEKADEVYRYLAQRVAQGEQAYVVVPIIDAPQEDSAPQPLEASGRGPVAAAQLKNLRSHLKLLQDKFCRGLKVAAVHGRLKTSVREAIMDRFRRGEIQVLVATTVIEVGVDVPKATIMVVEHAERFGLAQLHQLRGRVGRGDHGRQSLCVFIAQPGTAESQKRMQAIAGSTDGFVIAEADLAIRGMGDFFGTRQHGLPSLRVARIPGDMDLLKLARLDAQALVQADPALIRPEHRLLRGVLMREYGESLGLVDVG